MRRAVLVYNSASGAHLFEGDGEGEGGEGPPRERAAQHLRRHGLEVETLEGDLDAQVRASLEAEADCVVAAGGDGTIRAVIDAHLLSGSGASAERPIGILPGGTMNLLAKDYGIPLDLDAAAALIARGGPRRVDIGVLRAGPEGQSREEIFLHTCLVGLPVRIGVHRERKRGSLSALGKASLAFHALATLGRDPVVTATFPATVEDGAERTLRARSFALAVGELEGALLPTPRRRDVTDGLVTVIAMSAESSLGIARAVLAGISSDWRGGEDLLVERTARVRLDDNRRRMHVMLDGESRLLANPLDVSVRREAVHIISGRGAPAPDADPSQEGPP